MALERGGFGIASFGRSQFGHADTDTEPRFDSSFPADGSINISIFATTIMFDIYCFSDMVQDEGLLVEISENGGTSYAYAYRNSAFVAPYNGARSRTDAQLADPQLFSMVIHKTSQWANEQEIKVRVTAFDEYGNEATKEVPIRWE
jgi:hypothetical protein